MIFDGRATDTIQKAAWDAVLAFMAAQGEADYKNRARRRGVESPLPMAEGMYVGRQRAADYAAIEAWRTENGASIKRTAEYFSVGTATVKRACAE